MQKSDSTSDGDASKPTEVGTALVSHLEAVLQVTCGLGPDLKEDLNKLRGLLEALGKMKLSSKQVQNVSSTLQSRINVLNETRGIYAGHMVKDLTGAIAKVRANNSNGQGAAGHVEAAAQPTATHAAQQ